MTTLTYFPIRARAEASRLALEHAGVAYTDKRVTFEDWPALKPTVTFGQLPFFEDAEVKIPQSNAILRHVGRTNKLYGSSNAEAAQIDAAIDGAEDFLTGIVKAVFNPKFKEDRSDVHAAIDKWVELFSKTLSNNDFLVGSSATIADFALFNVINNFAKPLKTEAVTGNAAVEAWRQRISALPNIAAYLASDRLPATTMPAFAGVLCTPEECK